MDPTGFRHDAVLYSGEREFVERMSAFARDAIAATEPILVMVRGDKIEALRDELGPDADEVRFEDMGELGRNPSRIIPAWEDFFANQAAGRPARGIGEPIWAGRSEAEIVESQRHEALINLAFQNATGWLICPYDQTTLGEREIEEAHRSHPTIVDDGSRYPSSGFRGVAEIPAAFDAALPQPPPDRRELRFDERGLSTLRGFVAECAVAAGMPRERVEDAVLSVSELATNSIRHGGGSGTLRIWREGAMVVAEVSDSGRIDQPLVGRRRPPVTAQGGFGLWLVNQLCDLVQLRTFATGSVVRVHIAARPPA